MHPVAQVAGNAAAGEHAFGAESVIAGLQRAESGRHGSGRKRAQLRQSRSAAEGYAVDLIAGRAGGVHLDLPELAIVQMKGMHIDRIGRCRRIGRDQ